MNSAPQDHDQHDGTQESSGGNVQVTRWLIFGLVMLVATPIIWQQTRHEIARWYSAAAAEYLSHDDVAAAHAAFDNALAWNPLSADVLLARAQHYQKARQYDKATADCERVLEAFPNSAVTRRLKCELLQLQGDHKSAIKIHREMLDEVLADDAKSDDHDSLGRRYRRAGYYNGVAYAHALADDDVNQGMTYINKAIEETGGYKKMLVAFADLWFIDGDTQLSYDTFDSAFLIAAAKVSELDAQLNDDQTYQEQHPIKLEKARIEKFIQEAETLVARRVRHLERQRNRREKVKQSYRDWLLELYDQATLEAGGLEAQSVIARAQTHAAVLDTRGFLHYRRGDLASALCDLDIATTVMETARQLDLELTIKQHSEQMSAVKADDREAMDHGLAVMLYHRALVLRRLHRDAEADADLKKVRELGFEPDESLI